MESTRRGYLWCVAGGTLAAAVTGRAVAQGTEFEETWPRHAYDSGSTGHAPGNTAPKSDVSERWRASVDGGTLPFFAVDERRIYGTRQEEMYALDRATGEIEWRYDRGKPERVSLYDGTLYVTGDGGRAESYVAAVDTEDGSERWHNEYVYAFYGVPTAADGTVYAATIYANGRTYALDPSTGEELWVSEVGGELGTAATVGTDALFAGSMNGVVYAIDRASGAERWRAEVGDEVRSDPAVGDGSVYVACNDGRLYAFEADSGTERWTYETGGLIGFHTPAVADGIVYVGDVEGALHAIEADSGTERWTVETDGRVNAPVVADGVVFAPGDALYALEADSGEPLWQYGFEGDDNVQTPAVADGEVYVDGRELVALEGDIAPPTPTPTATPEGPPTRTRTDDDAGGDGDASTATATEAEGGSLSFFAAATAGALAAAREAVRQSGD
jgi:outer membrane protein assembly factor BamB